MEISEICRGNKILISLPDSKIRIPNLEVEVQGISIFGEIECLHTPQKEGYTIDVRHCSGVPITANILHNLKFENVADFWSDIDNRLSILLTSDCGVVFLNFLENSRLKEIKYLHELQNLYWVLFNKKLK
ncbi:hypothetical protein P2559Y_0048 [Croceibacter phage P2559Y]|uniref:hypothetical protein n=1 Tax=Croceibacter phage P2559Y TaxID=1327037 RepID=UPI0003F4A8CD|nr:hypothetical protein P2559Y_0048 [Croceibacter phage P2559Y]AGM14111.1 hypothetical protein P2559Y_0048 [Croceibacter phage P2559Y]